MSLGKWILLSTILADIIGFNALIISIRREKMLVIAVVLIIIAVAIGGFLFIAGLISGLNGEDWLTEEEKAKRDERKKKRSTIFEDDIFEDHSSFYGDVSADLTASYLKDMWDKN